MKSNHDLFYCYDPSLARYLKQEVGLPFLTKARHLETKKVFHLFIVDNELQSALEEYKKVAR